MEDEVSYTFPNATSIVLLLCTMYKPIRTTTTSEGSLDTHFVSGSAQLPFVLTRAPKTYIYVGSRRAD